MTTFSFSFIIRRRRSQCSPERLVHRRQLLRALPQVSAAVEGQAPGPGGSLQVQGGSRDFGDLSSPRLASRVVPCQSRAYNIFVSSNSSSFKQDVSIQGSPEAETRKKSRESFLDELRRCEMLGLKLYNIHPGSTCNKISRDKCIAYVRVSGRKYNIPFPSLQFCKCFWLRSLPRSTRR